MPRHAHPYDYLDLVGQEIGVSDWLAIDQARIDAFADATGDHQWIHVDTARAKEEMPGGATIAHGFLVLSLLPHMSEAFFRVDNLARSINYGLNRVRFTATVPVGARLRLRQSLKSAEKRPDGSVQLVLDSVMEMDGHDRPAMVAETVRLLYPVE